MRAGTVKQLMRKSTAGTSYNLAVEVHHGEAEVGASLVKVFEAEAVKAIKEKGSFVVAVPGGSVLKMLGALTSSTAGIDWSKVYLFYANHKCVPVDDKASTHKKAKDLFLDALKVPADNVAHLRGTPDAKSEAADYERHLKQIISKLKVHEAASHLPSLDLLVLGMGADGHVGSLYPGRAETTETKGWVLPVTKKEPSSITLSAPIMSAAQTIVIAMAGANKAPAVKTALGPIVPAGEMPAQMVQPTVTGASLVWLMDEAAAAELKL